MLALDLITRYFVMADNMSTTERLDEALRRVRSIFVGQPIFRDLQCRRTAFFSVTDFLKPIDAVLVDDIAQCMVSKVDFKTCDVIVSVADRTSGPLTHQVSVLTGVPYTLANWYPHGSPGEIEIEHCAGFNGDGLVFLNGLRRNHNKAIIIMDVLKSGATAGNLVSGLERHGVQVVHCVFATEIVEAGGRRHSALMDIPITTLVPIHMRGECTKEAHIKDDGRFPRSVTPTKNSIQRSNSPSSTPRGTALDSPRSRSPPRTLDPSLVGASLVPRTVPSIIRVIKKMDNATLRAKVDRVAATFLHIPIHNNPHLSYPYSFFTLTDFVPLMQPSLVEDMADLCVYYGDFERCDLIVSEADRGGGPLAQAVSMRTNKPFVLANWYSSGEGLGAASRVQVGFSGQGNIVVNGVSPGQRCTFLDDMLSSGGTAEGVLRSIVALGGIPIEGVFISEKLYPPSADQRLPVRKGKNRLLGIWAHLEVTTVVQFVAEGERTRAPLTQVG